MTHDKSILFVCTGNIFRSPTAELSFKKYLHDNGITGWKVGSAGTEAVEQPIHPATFAALLGLGIDASKHKQAKLTREMLDEYDVVVAMAQSHLDYMHDELGYDKALLFNDLAANKKESVNDIGEGEHHHTFGTDETTSQIEHTVRDIHEKIPAVYTKVNELFYSK